MITSLLHYFYKEGIALTRVVLDAPEQMRPLGTFQSL